MLADRHGPVAPALGKRNRDVPLSPEPGAPPSDVVMGLDRQVRVEQPQRGLCREDSLHPQEDNRVPARGKGRI